MFEGSWIMFVGAALSAVLSLEQTFSGICREPGDICASLLRLESKVVLPETDQYCASIHCDTTWSDNNTDLKSFTWRHHTRPDWAVQYKQHSAMTVPEEVCTGRDLVGALVTSDADHWAPKVSNVQCHCQENIYDLSGWTLIEEYNRWEYYYTCNMSVCNVTDTCLEKYVDPKTRHVMAAEFGCVCPNDYKCDEEKPVEVQLPEMDYITPDIVGYCRKIQTRH